MASIQTCIYWAVLCEYLVEGKALHLLGIELAEFSL